MHPEEQDRNNFENVSLSFIVTWNHTALPYHAIHRIKTTSYLHAIAPDGDFISSLRAVLQALETVAKGSGTGVVPLGKDGKRKRLAFETKPVNSRIAAWGSDIVNPALKRRKIDTKSNLDMANPSLLKSRRSRTANCTSHDRVPEDVRNVSFSVNSVYSGVGTGKRFHWSKMAFMKIKSNVENGVALKEFTKTYFVS